MPVYKVLFHALGHAAYHSYYYIAARLASQRIVVGQPRMNLLLGVVADAARVQNHGRGLLLVVRRLIANCL